MAKGMMRFACAAMALFAALACTVAAAAAANNELPKELGDSSMFCEGCFGTVSEVAAMMEQKEAAGIVKGSTLNERIERALGAVCHTDNLRKYVFSPPKMVKVTN